MKIASINLGSLFFNGIKTPYQKDMAFILNNFPINICDRANIINPFLQSIFPIVNGDMSYNEFGDIVKRQALLNSEKKNIYILYSGGLDSTLLLLSLLEAGCNLTVSMTESSRFENIEMYEELVYKGIKLDWALKDLKNSASLYNIIDGSCCDSLFGSNLFNKKKSQLSELKINLSSFDKNRGSIFFAMLLNSIEASGLKKYVTNMQDLEIWLANIWNYQADFFYLKHLMDEGIQSHSFYNHDEFRIWGINNCKNFKDHDKKIIRDLIKKFRPEWEYPYFKLKKESAQLLNTGVKMKNPVFDTKIQKVLISELAIPENSIIVA